jgi:hypothetical protein
VLSTRVACAFLRHGAWLQYTACGRHPAEFISNLRLEWERYEGSKEAWEKIAGKIVIVDAFTPHFGFTDSIHVEMSKWLETSGIWCAVSGPTYAGIHSGAAKAFNELKRRQGKKVPREFTLVCYESPSAIMDVESVEQYRIFIRHVASSERLWGGMFTLFLEEKTCPEAELALTRQYTPITVDLA